jgi:uncharacterized protein
MKQQIIDSLKRRRKRMITLSLTCLVIGLIGFILLEEHVLPYMPIKPFRGSLNTLPSDFGLVYDTLQVPSDSLILRGYFIHALKRPQATVILLHGIGSCKENWLAYARILAENGFNSVVYDQRAHGKSDGDYCTFGFYEKHDVSRMIDTALTKNPRLPIGIQGASLGGAVALQALAQDKRLAFGIVESTFNTLENVVEKYGYNYFKFKSRWLVRRILTKAAVIARFRPFEVKPVEACRHINQPILMVHGDADEKIPIEFNSDNFTALASAEKEFFVVKGAGHDNVGEVGGEAYKQKILGFLKRTIATIKANDGQNTPSVKRLKFPKLRKNILKKALTTH